MDGPTALWYVRSRKSSSDYDRMRRMQEVVSAMFTRLMNMNAMVRVPELVTTYSDSIETNLKVSKILPLLPIASEVFNDTSRIHSYAVNQEYTTESWSWNGMWILLPDLERINGMLSEAGVNN
jgi:anionic cell wall polymer biosynthesis LytR-Cps2A-Psr (LCP) family protein